MTTIKLGDVEISADGPVYVIAEIGHNHQGDLSTAKKLIDAATYAGVHAVKLQKRENKTLYTKAMYNKPYENENSYGSTYGEHRDFLEFGKDEYQQLKEHADARDVEFFATPFDIPSVDFLEEVGVRLYKVASGDVTNIPLLTYIAKTGKPMIVSTGAANLDEVRRAYETVLAHNDQLVLMHCAAGYPTDYPDLHLRVVETYKQEFPEALIGYSGHDNGILAAVIAHMLGAVVFEKHFTLNRSFKGTDHKFSLEPEGMRKQVRDLQRVKIALGEPNKVIREFERDARMKMGKSIYAARDLPAGTILTEDDLCLKSPGGGLEPYYLSEVLGRKLRTDLSEEEPLTMDRLEA